MNNQASALTAVYEQLADFANQNNFWNIFNTAFGTNYDRSLVETIRLRWANRDFSQIPAIRVLDSGMDNILGAYASSTDTIYLSQTLLDTAPTSQIVAVILEEIGHSIDNKINLSDSAGDEGKIFSALVRGINLSAPDLQTLKSTNDSATILVDGKAITVETFTIFPPTIAAAVSPSVLENGSTNIVYTFTRYSAVAITDYNDSLTLDYSLGGTATLGTDYTTSGAVTFAPGATTTTLTIVPIDDNLVEGDETIDLVVGVSPAYYIPTGIEGTLFNPAWRIITDDDSFLSLSISSSTVNENEYEAINLVYTFTRTNTLTPLIVNFTIGGTATFNTDYTQSGATTFAGSTGTINFATGVDTATITISPIADRVTEGNETISLTLASGKGYTVSTIAAVTGAIVNEGFKIAQTTGNDATPRTYLLTDNFTATDTSVTTNLNYNQANRQTGSLLGTTNWIASGNTQVGNPTAGIDGGNYLLTAGGATAALDRNFNGINAQGGLRFSFDLAPNATAHVGK